MRLSASSLSAFTGGFQPRIPCKGVLLRFAGTSETPPELTGLLNELRSAGYDTPEAMVAETLQANRLQGESKRAVVLEIPRLPQYVLRVSKRNLVLGPDDHLKAAENPFGNRNFGQAVAEIGFMSILKKQPGLPCGIPAMLFGDTVDITTRRSHYRAYLQSLLQIPQKQGYDALARDLMTVNPLHYGMDTNPNNILYDVSHGRFHLVDLVCGRKNDLGDLAYSLMDHHFLDRDPVSLADPALRAMRKQILQRVILAGYRAHLPLPAEGPYAAPLYSMAYAFAQAGMPGQWPSVRQAMEACPNTGKASRAQFLTQLNQRFSF